MKKFWYKLCVAAVIFTLSAGCAATAFAYEESDITTVTQQYLDSWNQTDFSSYDETTVTDEEMLEEYKEWQSLKEQLGEFDSVADTVITDSEDGATVSCVMNTKFKNGNMTFTVVFDAASIDASISTYGSALYAVSDISAETASDGAKGSLGKAGLNTLMAMAIVFTVLITISFIIYLLRYVPGLLGQGKKKEEPADTQPAPSAPAVSEDLTDDTELVAVITAAIAAYEENTAAASGDGFVVRSIRRRY